MSVWVTWPALTKLGTLGIFAGLITLAMEREALFENNLIDVENYERHNADITCDPRSEIARTEDGTCNILSNPSEGSVYMRFSRNVGLSAAHAETDTLLTPNPREVSNVLMARDEFKPAPSLNFIAAAWIQFMIHDWFDHGPNAEADPIQIPLPAGDPLGSGTMSVRRTQADPSRTPDEAALPQTFRNHNTHWWDGSQLYGSSKEASDKVRSFVDGKLKIDANNRLPREFVSGKPVTGFNENWWLGLSMLHQLFTLEHNAIADRLKARYPDKDDQWLYDKARLINSALMAKIHTVEWTPAVIANPVTERAMYSNWWGLLGQGGPRSDFQEEVRKLREDLAKSDSFITRILGFDPNLSDGVGNSAIDHALTGIVGSAATNNYGVPFSLSEEFVAVYRMHPLMRDNIEVYDIGSNLVSRTIPLQNAIDREAENLLAAERPERLWYSFGITNPGSLTLNNYPGFLRDLSLPLVGNVDMATIDVLRDRERGVPRYNEFRRQIGLNPITKFEDLTKDPETLANLKRLYNNDIEQIDALVGQLAETVRPDGFAFGETAFQIFISAASRRLMADRFYTQDYRPEVYTQEGIDWVEHTTMVDVLKRHNPQLNSSLVGVENAFKPWGLNIPADYESWPAANKMENLWVNGALRTQYQDGELPPLVPVDVGGLIGSILWDKVKKNSDVAPVGYSKPIHPHGVMAKVRFVPTANNGYTGLFASGSDHSLLRLSVTGDPADRGFAPGLAWKAFVDGQPSKNVSALYTLSGQGGNYNFFANELSQFVQTEANETLGTTILFSAVTLKPTLLRVDDMAKVKQDGSAVSSPKAPTQIYFVPRAEVKSRFASTPHDFREDLLSIEEGTKVYDVYATSTEIKTSIFPSLNQRYANERRSSARKIGEIELASPFIASAFGDTGVFFKHQRHEDK
ncbi:peroxidase family protein [Pseudomonas flexibilis]|uniref:Peroxidase n=1 Tax=Pseudomonas flexibilis TaxID=706570 RepID=A0A0B3BUY2_9PSED|nr:peroxidase family protein [Pseudomonas flexibilis]KHO66460.1 peroxidase [Pseudomonas flexibilis]SCY34956.1 Animal haem peroxidase [Pseudomonas flexibilis]